VEPRQAVNALRGRASSTCGCAHAKKSATEHQPACTYRLGDLRNGGFVQGFDLVMLICGQINVFRLERAQQILRGAAGALKHGGPRACRAW
jgi:hypothetical protein